MLIVADGDLRRPETILDGPEVRRHLDWDRPIGLLLCGILHHIRDEEHPEELMKVLCEAIPPGSYVLIHHLLDRGIVPRGISPLGAFVP